MSAVGQCTPFNRIAHTVIVLKVYLLPCTFTVLLLLLLLLFHMTVACFGFGNSMKCRVICFRMVCSAVIAATAEWIWRDESNILRNRVVAHALHKSIYGILEADTERNRWFKSISRIAACFPRREIDYVKTNRNKERRERNMVPMQNLILYKCRILVTAALHVCVRSVMCLYEPHWPTLFHDVDTSAVLMF